MTVRVTSLRGADVGAYYVDLEHAGLGRYYFDAGEPPGVWLGAQAIALGLRGEIDPDAFLALVDGAGPSGEQLGRAYNEKSVRGYDITFSAPKSVSTLWALGDEHVVSESLAAHDAAVRAVLDFVERHATTRATIDGVVQNVELAVADRPVFGLAPSAAAAEVLGEEAGITADTVDKLLVEYSKSGQLPDPRYMLPAGTTVIVDSCRPRDYADPLSCSSGSSPSRLGLGRGWRSRGRHNPEVS